jgi:hypothetical protein
VLLVRRLIQRHAKAGDVNGEVLDLMTLIREQMGGRNTKVKGAVLPPNIRDASVPLLLAAPINS